MGRKQGVTAEQTRGELLEAAARVFALKGYDGASIADITAEANLSSGAIYAHYKGKAELFVAVVREHGEAEFRNLVGGPVDRSTTIPDVVDVVTRIGSTYARAEPTGGTLLIEAVVASQRHPEIAEMIRAWLLEGEDLMSGELAAAQDAGLLMSGFSADAAGRFLTLVGLGARLAGALQLPDVDPDRWSQLIELLAAGLRTDGGPTPDT